jgi:DUF4097 and DUF4098 domain-containing protein YvlB
MEPMTFETTDGLWLEVRVPAGTVEVRASDSNEARVEVTGERDPDDVTIRFDPRASGRDRLLVEHRERKFLAWGNGAHGLRVTVDVPAGTEVEMESGSADLDVSARIGPLTFRSGSGDLTFGDTSGGVTAKVASGDVRGAGVGGDLAVTSASGDVRVRSVSGSVDAKSASGDVSIGGVSTGAVNVRTASGDVEIGVEAGATVWLDLISTSGETSSELESTTGDEAAATSTIRAVSVSGDVRVRRATVRS